jgi:uncharacterized protein YggE
MKEIKKAKSRPFMEYSIGIFFSIAAAAVVVGAIILAGSGSSNETNTISVSAQAEVFTSPDIADISFTLQHEAKTVTLAQDLLSKQSAQLFDVLGNLIDEEDIKTTNYTTNPKYEWLSDKSTCKKSGDCDRKQTITGYSASQNVSLKLRELTESGEVLAILGEQNVHSLSGPNFRIEDPEEFKAQAREIAIEKAKIKAEDLAKTLDVDLGKLVNFWEGGGIAEPYMEASFSMMQVGSAMDSKIAPSVPSGEERVTISVSLTYEIK